VLLVAAASAREKGGLKLSVPDRRIRLDQITAFANCPNCSVWDALRVDTSPVPKGMTVTRSHVRTRSRFGKYELKHCSARAALTLQEQT
jgi:hypothetical protein